MALSQQKVSTADLVPGMYVAKLDRPWIETPFPIQGFHLRDPKQIEVLRSYCQYVFIDVDFARPMGDEEKSAKAISGKKGRAAVRASNGKTYRPEKGRSLKFKPVRYEKKAEIKREVLKANRLHSDVARLLTHVHNKIRTGKEFNYEYVQGAARAVTASILRNPDALVWLSRVRDTDTYTYNHSVRSAILAGVFARHLGLPQEEIEKLVQGCLLADVGKTRIPGNLLKKAGKLDSNERKQVEEHVLHGWDILSSVEGISPEVLSIVQLHHERYDGSGYPFGLQGSQIPLLVQIASIVDVYDAVTSPRPYASEIPTTDAVSMMYEMRGKGFQEQLVEHFIQAIGIYPSGTLVELDTGEVGIVIEQNRTRRLKPVVMVLLDHMKEKLNRMKVLDLMALEETANAIAISRSLCPGSYNLHPGNIQVGSKAA